MSLKIKEVWLHIGNQVADALNLFLNRFTNETGDDEVSNVATNNSSRILEEFREPGKSTVHSYPETLLELHISESLIHLFPLF